MFHIFVKYTFIGIKIDTTYMRLYIIFFLFSLLQDFREEPIVFVFKKFQATACYKANSDKFYFG